MPKNPTDLSQPALRRAIKANWVEYYRYLGRARSAELHAGPHLNWLLTPIPDAFNNVVFQTYLPPKGGREIIEHALAHFRTRGVAKLSWWTEGTQAAELGKLLAANGLTFNEGGRGMVADAMAADLPALPQPPLTPPGLTIAVVENAEMLALWARVVNTGFGHTPETARAWLELFADLGFELPLRSYLAVLDGQPVGTSQLFVGAGVAGIYNVTCLPEARGRGVGAAATSAALADARELGYRYAILQASHLGYSVYRRLGFKEYGKLGQYRWDGGDGEIGRWGGGEMG